MLVDNCQRSFLACKLSIWVLVFALYQMRGVVFRLYIIEIKNYKCYILIAILYELTEFWVIEKILLNRHFKTFSAPDNVFAVRVCSDVLNLDKPLMKMPWISITLSFSVWVSSVCRKRSCHNIFAEASTNSHPFCSLDVQLSQTMYHFKGYVIKFEIREFAYFNHSNHVCSTCST